MQILFLLALAIGVSSPSKREPSVGNHYCSSTSFSEDDGVAQPMQKSTQVFSEDGKTVRRESFVFLEGAFDIQYATTSALDGHVLKVENYGNGKVVFDLTIQYEDPSDTNLITSFIQGPTDPITFRRRVDLNTQGEIVRQAYDSDDGRWMHSTIFSKTDDGATQSTQTYDENSTDVEINYTSADGRTSRSASLYRGKVVYEQFQSLFENGEAEEVETKNSYGDVEVRERSVLDEDQNLIFLQTWMQGELVSDFQDTHEFTWDAEGRMTQKMTKRIDLKTQNVSSESTLSFSYDDQGRVIERSVRGTFLEGKVPFGNREVITYKGCGLSSRLPIIIGPDFKSLMSVTARKAMAAAAMRR